MEKSDVRRTQNDGNNKISMIGTNAQSMDFHLTDISNNLEGRNNNKNNPIRLIDSALKMQQGRQGCVVDKLDSSRNTQHNTMLETHQSVGPITIRERKKTQLVVN